MFTFSYLHDLGQGIWPLWAWILFIYKMCMTIWTSQECWKNSVKQCMWKYIINLNNYISILFVHIYSVQHLLNICFLPHLVLRIRTLCKHWDVAIMRQWLFGSWEAGRPRPGQGLRTSLSSQPFDPPQRPSIKWFDPLTTKIVYEYKRPYFPLYTYKKLK